MRRVDSHIYQENAHLGIPNVFISILFSSLPLSLPIARQVVVLDGEGGRGEMGGVSVVLVVVGVRVKTDANEPAWTPATTKVTHGAVISGPRLALDCSCNTGDTRYYCPVEDINCCPRLLGDLGFGFCKIIIRVTLSEVLPW